MHTGTVCVMLTCVRKWNAPNICSDVVPGAGMIVVCTPQVPVARHHELLLD